MRPACRRQSLVQRHLAVGDPTEPTQARGTDGVGLRLPRGITERRELLGSSAQERLDLIESLGVDEDRKLTIEARAPGRKLPGIACRAP